MDEIRRRIADRLAEMGKSQSWLSQQLGRNRGYIFEYFEGSPDDLAYETKLQIAEKLNMDPRDLGVTPIVPMPRSPAGGLSEDGTPYDPPAGHFLSRQPHIAYFRCTSNVLDQHPKRILPGAILAFDLNCTRPALIETGRIVIVQLYDKKELTKSQGTIFREFVAPNKLVTNSSGENEILSLDNQALPVEPIIKGALLSVIGDMN